MEKASQEYFIRKVLGNSSDIKDEQGRAIAKQLGEMACYTHLNVKNEGEWQLVYDQILLDFGGLDILVNNAGITGFLETNGPFDGENPDMESFEKVMRVNLIGTVLGCKYGIQLMKRKGKGSNINISS